MTGNLNIPAEQWLKGLFTYEWCPECGRDHRHHTAVAVLGNWFAHCDLEPVFSTADGGELEFNPEKYEDA